MANNPWQQAAKSLDVEYLYPPHPTYGGGYSRKEFAFNTWDSDTKLLLGESDELIDAARINVSRDIPCLFIGKVCLSQELGDTESPALEQEQPVSIRQYQPLGLTVDMSDEEFSQRVASITDAVSAELKTWYPDLAEAS